MPKELMLGLLFIDHYNWSCSMHGRVSVCYLVLVSIHCCCQGGGQSVLE